MHIEEGLLTLRREGTVSVLTLDDGRGNALGRAMLEAVERALDLAQDSSALVLRGREKIFSGGLDLPSLASLDRDGMAEFVALFVRVHTRLLGYPVPMVTAARGSAVAGGAILLSAGDVRLVTPSGKVGINEVVLGLNFPTSALEIVRRALGDRRMEEAATTGRLYEGEERVRIGFATEVVASEDMDQRAMQLAQAFTQTDRTALALVREQTRRPFLDRVRTYSEQDSKAFLDRWFDPATQGKIRALVERLGAGR